MAVLTDYHFHTELSHDSVAPYYDMVMAEYNAGVRRLCTTDHCDVIHWQTREFLPECRTLARRELEAYQAVRDRLPPDLELRMGMELAELFHYPELTEELTSPPWLDYILGSAHVTMEFGDYSLADYADPSQRERIYDIYLRDLQRAADLNYFDAMAHIGYIRRYAMRAGVDMGLTLARHGERIEHLLRTIIQNGRGIEINCSGLRDGCGPFPSEEILRLYKSLGGEIVTIGSDAHRPQDAAKCLARGQEVLKACGFRYIAAFTKHKPSFIPI